MAGDFGSVTHPQVRRYVMGQCEAFDDVFPCDRDIHGVIQDQAGVFVDDRGDLEAGAVFEVVRLEIDRPDVTGRQRHGECFAGGGAATSTTPPDRPTFAYITPEALSFM